MAAAKCAICSENDARYKCPKCRIGYCSLACFKAPAHVHNETTREGSPAASLPPQAQTQTQTQRPSFDDPGVLARLAPATQRVLQNDTDGRLKALLALPQLQIQLMMLAEILANPAVTNEASRDSRRDVAVKKWESLRASGLHANELAEEFSLVFEEMHRQ